MKPPIFRSVKLEVRVYDVAIIGLGPAGATLARLLSSKYNIIAIDKKDMSGEGGFRKPCGGLLAMDAQKSLSQFNLTLPKEILVDPQIFAVKTIDTRQDIMRYYQRFYINMDRHKFDLWLMGLVPDSVKVADAARCVALRKEEDGYTVEYKRKGESFTIKAKYIVGADGANSIVRRTLFPKAEIRKYVSIQQWFRDENVRPLYSCFFDSGITDCYSWSISKDGYFIAGGAFPIQDSRKRFEELKQKLVKSGYILGEAVKTEACMLLRPSSPFEFCTGGGGAFLLGEAAGFISPSSLEGISYSFESAKKLAGVLNGNYTDPNSVYDKKILGMKAKLSIKMLKSIFMYVPLARRIVMRSGLNSINVIEEK